MVIVCRDLVCYVVCHGPVFNRIKVLMFAGQGYLRGFSGYGSNFLVVYAVVWYISDRVYGLVDESFPFSLFFAFSGSFKVCSVSVHDQACSVAGATAGLCTIDICVRREVFYVM